MPQFLSIRVQLIGQQSDGASLTLVAQDYVDLDDDPVGTFSRLVTLLRYRSELLRQDAKAPSERIAELEGEIAGLRALQSRARAALVKARQWASDAEADLGALHDLPF